MSENLNTTMNGTQSLSCFSNPTYSRKNGITFVYCLIFLVSLPGNTVIGVIVYKAKAMRKPINFFIVTMAMSDLLFTLFFIPREIQLFYINTWLIGGPLGQALCKLVILLSDVSFAVSIQSLVLIAVDRFGAVVFPLRSPLITSKLCPFFILATWMVAMAFFSPYLFVVKLVENPGGLACGLYWNEAFGGSSSFSYFIVAYMLVCNFIPLVLTAILYIIIYLKLKSHKIPGEHSVNAGQQHLQRERNVLKMAIAIVLGFAVCWMPNVMSVSIHVFGSDIMTKSCGFHFFSSVALFMLRANCAINPCICFNFSSNYRKELKTFLKCK